LISGKSVVHLRGSYAEGAEDEIFVIAGSSGYLEIAANRASAAEKLQAGAGAEVRVVVY
jgi:S-adenosylmethionine hydrolase